MIVVEPKERVSTLLLIPDLMTLERVLEYHPHLAVDKVLIRKVSTINKAHLVGMVFFALQHNLELSMELICTHAPINHVRNGRTPLHVALRNKFFGIVRTLLLRQADCNIPDDERGSTALHIAVRIRNHYLVYDMLQKDADPNKADVAGCTAMHYAVTSGDNEMIINHLLEAGANVDAKTYLHRRTPLMYAVEKGHFSLVRMLVQKGRADLSHTELGTGMNVLHMSLSKGRIYIAEFLVQQGIDVTVRDARGRTALHYATDISCSREGILKPLMESLCVRISDNAGLTPLHLAIRKENPTMALELLRKGANPSARDADGTAPINMAVYARADFIEMLADNGADLNNRIDYNYGPAALHQAVKIKNLDRAQTLIEKGANINLGAKRTGWTALHYAVEGHYMSICKYLIGMDADDNMPDNNNITPKELARMVGFYEYEKGKADILEALAKLEEKEKQEKDQKQGGDGECRASGLGNGESTYNDIGPAGYDCEGAVGDINAVGTGSGQETCGYTNSLTTESKVEASTSGNENANEQDGACGYSNGLDPATSTFIVQPTEDLECTRGIGCEKTPQFEDVANEYVFKQIDSAESDGRSHLFEDGAVSGYVGKYEEFDTGAYTNGYGNIPLFEDGTSDFLIEQIQLGEGSCSYETANGETHGFEDGAVGYSVAGQPYETGNGVTTGYSIENLGFEGAPQENGNSRTTGVENGATGYTGGFPRTRSSRMTYF